MKTTRKNTAALVGTVLAAFGASVCCILPVAVAVLGVGSAALGAKLEPLRPVFLVLTIAVLGSAFYRAYRAEPCEPGQACAVPSNRRRQRIVLWIVAAVALALTTFPYYAGSLL
jgi:mercuric ion transport protein